MNNHSSDPVAPLPPVVVEIDEHLIGEMIAFGRDNFPPGDPNLNRAYLHWLCVENPCGKAQAIVIRDGDRLVGQAVLVPVDLAINSTITRAYFVVSVLTHPEFRNRRLFSTIIDAAKLYVSARGEWLLGHPNAAALPGWQRKEMSFRTPLVPHFSGIAFGVGHRIQIIDTEVGLIKAWAHLGPCIALKPDGMVRIVRTLDYMVWRFMRRPDKAYRLGLCWERNGILSGYYAATAWKHLLDLVVDHVRSDTETAWVGTDRPSIVMLPKGREVRKAACFSACRLPVRKVMPFFASTFTTEVASFDNITLAVTDF